MSTLTASERGALSLASLVMMPLPRHRERDYAGAMSYAAAGGRGTSSNYPTELRALVQSEDDSLLRQDVLYRDDVRQHLVAGRLASSQPGRPDWEKGYLKRAQESRRKDRVEERRLLRAARQARS